MSDYLQKQSEKDARARRDYAALEDSLSPEVKEILADKKGRVTLAEDYEASHTHADISEMQIAAPEAGEINPYRELALSLLRALSEIIRAKNVRLEVTALIYATGLAECNGLGTMRSAAKQIIGANGQPITVSALSKRTNELVRQLGLRRNAALKSEVACQSYSEARKKNHWRKNGKRNAILLNRLEQKPNKEKE